MNTNRNTSDRHESLVDIMLHRFMPYWLMFTVLVVLLLGCAQVYLHFTTPTFEATATLIIKDEQKGVDDSKIMESMNVFNSKKIVENEIEVIQSRDLIRRVVDDLYLYAPVFVEGNIKATSAYTISPVCVEFENPDEMRFDPKTNAEIFFTVNQAVTQVQVGGDRYPLGEWVNSPYGKMRFIKNPYQQETTKSPLFFALASPKAVVRRIQGGLEVKPTDKLSTVIHVVLKDEVPERAEDILNRLIFWYGQSSVTEREKLAANTLQFIDERMEEVEAELEVLEGEVQLYRSSKGVVNLSEQGRFYLENVGDYDRKISDINLQLAILERVENYVLSKEDDSGSMVPSTFGISDPVLSELISKLYNAEMQYDRLSKTTARNNPVLQSIEDEIEKIRPSILDNIRSQRENLKQTLVNLNATHGKYDFELQQIPVRERELLEINRRKSVKTQQFAYLLQKREETALFYAPNEADSKVVDKAQVGFDPIEPKPLIIYSLAIILAFVVGITYVMYKEVLNKNILFRSEIEEYTHRPIIEELPNIKKNKKDTRFTKPDDPVVLELFRQMGAKLGLYGRRFNRKTILVTSSIPGEGKSFVSSNLAYSLAASGKKVALLDMDFRKPNTSRLFGMSNHTGIIDFLKSEARFEDLLNTSDVSENLVILPAGTEGGDHAQTIMNGKLELLFQCLNQAFTYIIIDSAPLDLVFEVNVLAEYTDLSLLVVRHGHTPRQVIKRLEESSKLEALGEVGIIFNGVKKRGMINPSYGYGYGYGHVYSYSNYYHR